MPDDKIRKKNLVITVDTDKKNEWQIKALSMQMSDYLKANRSLFGADNIIILPASGETRLYWLEGDTDNPVDVSAIEKIKDRLKPVLEVSFGIARHSEVIEPRGKNPNRHKKTL